MKKFLQVAVLLVFAFVVFSAAFSFTVNVAAANGAIPCTVAVTLENADSYYVVNEAADLCKLFPNKIPPHFQPLVGWNG